MKDDKIFGNKFNSGEIEYVPFPSIRIDTPENLDILDDYNALEMQKCLLEIFLSAPFYSDYETNRKIPKGFSCEIFYFFESELKRLKDIKTMEVFILVADFMEMKYETLYKEISIKHKETILKEMDTEYGIFKKKNIHRLF